MLDPFGRRLRQSDRLLAPIETSLNFIAGALVFGLMFLGVTQIVLRAAFRAPIFGYIDMVEVSMVGFAVLSISYVQRIGGHVRMELLVTHLKGRTHWIVEAIGTALAMFIVAVLIPYSYDHFMRAFEFGDSTIDIELSTWPAKLVVPVALGLLLFRLTIQFLGYLRLVADPGLEPIGVPLIKNVAQQAEEEVIQTKDDTGMAQRGEPR